MIKIRRRFKRSRFVFDLVTGEAKKIDISSTEMYQDYPFIYSQGVAVYSIRDKQFADEVKKGAVVVPINNVARDNVYQIKRLELEPEIAWLSSFESFTRVVNIKDLRKFPK